MHEGQPRVPDRGLFSRSGTRSTRRSSETTKLARLDAHARPPVATVSSLFLSMAVNDALEPI